MDGWKRRIRVAVLAAGLALSGGCGILPFERFESGFESPAWREWWAGERFESTLGLQEAEDGRYGFEPSLDGRGGKALRVKIAAGSNEGTHQLEFNFSEHFYEDPAEATASYLMRFARDFTPPEAGKLPGFAGTYGKAGWGPRASDGHNGWSARSMFYPSPKGEPIRVASLCYLADMAERGGRSGFFDWHEKRVPRLERDRWYHIVQHVKMNTIVEGRGAADGVLRVWVDGRLAVDERALVFRHSGELRIDRMWFNVHYGGGPAPRDMHVFFDEIVIRAGGPVAGERPGTSATRGPVASGDGATDGLAVWGLSRETAEGLAR